jgi:fatty acyl-CoA reductase
VDNAYGITGIMMEIGRGTIRSIICDQKLTMDLIPVDIVVNTLIGVAWHTATYRYRYNIGDTTVYLDSVTGERLRIL